MDKPDDLPFQIASTQPHAAHAGFVHGVRSKWTFCQRTMKEVAKLMKPLENVIRTKFLPALIGDETTMSDNAGEFGGPKKGPIALLVLRNFYTVKIVFGVYCPFKFPKIKLKIFSIFGQN